MPRAIITRFAPSPTGYLHVGNARVALINWLLAKSDSTGQGQFILRLDDTDTARSREEYATAIVADLDWLGLAPDQTFCQSRRGALYQAAADKLKADGRLYSCYETAEELSLKRKVQLSQGKPPLYDRAALELSDTGRAALEGEGRKPHWRFALNHRPICWDDGVRGHVAFEGSKLSDPVLIREDGSFLFTLPSVVDDMDMGITHIVRGEDHLTNTATHIQLMEALDKDVSQITFVHLSLLTSASGEGLSKRSGSASLHDLREKGLEAMAINSLLARLGTSDPVEARADLGAVLQGFDLAHFGHASPKYDDEELLRLNEKCLHASDLAQVSARLAALGLPEVSEDFWQAVRPNLAVLEDVKIWHEVCYGKITPVIEDAGFLNAAAALLPNAPFDDQTWGLWTRAVKQETGRKGRELFLPLRLALSGLDHGPSMQALLPLIGPARALSRLGGQTS